MVSPIRLDNGISVSPQVQPADLAWLAAQGFKTIINNRPDGEEPNQPTSAQMQQAAQEAGLHYIHQPVISGAISQQNIDEFGTLLADAEGPVFAFCRTGTRCSALWASSGDDFESRSAIAKSCGYDLSFLNK